MKQTFLTILLTLLSFGESVADDWKVAEPVDLGLSVKWASWNLGASKIADYGGLYGAGDPTGEKWSTDPNDYYYKEGETICGTEYDLARVKWGKLWRMPTTSELTELRDKCVWEYDVTIEGVKGCRATGPNGNSIFIPYAGAWSDRGFIEKGGRGSIFSGDMGSTRYESGYMDLDIVSYGKLQMDGCRNWCHQSIRPVYSETVPTNPGTTPTDPGTTTIQEQGYVLYDEATNTLTFKYGEMPSGSTVYDSHGGGWREHISTIEKVVFDPSFAKARPTSTSHWFYNATALSEIVGIEYLNTIDVNNMNCMFYKCSKLANLNVSHFDTGKASDMSYMFYGCTELTSLDVSNFNTSNVINMSGMFGTCRNLASLDVRNFNTSNVTNMSYMFYVCTELTSLDVSHFDTGKVSDMNYMFGSCNKLTSLDVSHFDTGNVTSMAEMFYGCSKLNSLDVSHFDTGNVTSMSRMFYLCSELTSLDVSHFNTGNVTNMSNMFYNCNKMASLDVSHFDTSKVTGMGGMFYGCSKLNSLDVSHFDTGNVTGMNEMFYGCSELTSLDVSHFDTGNVTGMSNMFKGCGKLTNLDISSFNTSKVTSMESMFEGCKSLTRLDLGNFDTGNVTTMRHMFGSCSSLEYLYVSNFNTSNVTDMNSMFGNCSSLTSLDVSHFNTSNVTDMNSLFYGCSGLTSLDVSHFNTSNVTNMQGLFSQCSSLTSLDVSNFDTRNVEGMAGMFYNCSGLTSLDVSHFNTSKVVNLPDRNGMGGMFNGCSGLTSLDVSNFDTSNLTSMDSMFKGCSRLKSLDISNFDTSNVKDFRLMFEDCSSLSSLNLGNFITSAVEYSDGFFSGCSNLADVYCSAVVVPNISSVKFEINQESTLHVAAGMAEKYKESSPWKLFKNIWGPKHNLIYVVDGEKYKTFEIEEGREIMPEAEPTKDGFSFSGWSEIPEIMPAHDVEITGTFTQVEYEIDDVTYEITGEGTATIKGGKQTGEVTIGSTISINGQTYKVTAIAENAFKDNQGITTLTIPDGVTTIGDSAFDGCTSLIVINIGKDVQAIGNKAFANVGTSSSIRTRGDESPIVVNCYPENVPQTALDAFENTPIEAGVLFVVDHIKDSFMSTAPWSRFGKIIGFEEAAGINTITTKTSNTLIFDMQGNRLDHVRKGVNIIRSNNGKTRKMVVK